MPLQGKNKHKKVNESLWFDVVTGWEVKLTFTMNALVLNSKSDDAHIQCDGSVIRFGVNVCCCWSVHVVCTCTWTQIQSAKWYHPRSVLFTKVIFPSKFAFILLMQTLSFNAPMSPFCYLYFLFSTFFIFIFILMMIHYDIKTSHSSWWP